MAISKYLARIMLRHGSSAQRLINELDTGLQQEEGVKNAIAFDAADFVWAVLAAYGFEKVQNERCLRNQVAEAIIEVLERGTALDILPQEPWHD